MILSELIAQLGEHRIKHGDAMVFINAKTTFGEVLSTSAVVMRDSGFETPVIFLHTEKS